MRCGGLSVTTWSHLVFLQGRGNSARSIAQIVDPVLFPFHRQEGGVLFQQDNTHPHTAAVMQHALRGIQQLTWTARLPDLSPIQHVWNMIKEELTFSSSLPQLLPNCNNGCRMAFGTFMTVYMWQYMLALLPEMGTQCIDVTVWVPLTVIFVFHLVWTYHHLLLQW